MVQLTTKIAKTIAIAEKFPIFLSICGSWIATDEFITFFNFFDGPDDLTLSNHFTALDFLSLAR